MRLLTSGRTLIGLQDSRPQYRMADPRSMPTFGSAKSPFRKKAEAARAEAKVLVEEICATGASQPELQSLNNLEEVRPDRESDGIRRSDGPLSPSLSPSPASVADTGAEGGEGENFEEERRGEKEEGRRETAESRKQKAEIGKGDDGTTGLQDHGKKQKAESRKADHGTTGHQDNGKKAEVRDQKSEFTPAQGPARVDRKFAWFGGAREWAERLGSWLPMRPRPARSATRMTGPQQGELPLSLDAVRVVRNDLSDCDLEFVTKKGEGTNGTTGQRDNTEKAEIRKQKLGNGNWENGAVGTQEQLSSGKATTEESGAFGAAWGRATRAFGAAFVRNESAELVEKT